MSRIYLIIFCFISLTLFAQIDEKEQANYLEIAKEQKEIGNNKEAIRFFKKVWESDSLNYDLIWELANLYRERKQHDSAFYFFDKIVLEEKSESYFYAPLFAAEQLKFQANYDEAINYFKRAKKFYASDFQSYGYKKAKQEIYSCLWANKNKEDSVQVHKDERFEILNTEGNEFSSTFYGQEFFFSRSYLDSNKVNQKDQKPYTFHTINHFKDNKENVFKELNVNDLDVGNGSFSFDKKRFYFSKCRKVENGLQCKLMVAYYVNGTMRGIDSLGPYFNDEVSNSTQPHITKLNGKEALIFSSNIGKKTNDLDLYYSYITDGDQYSKPLIISELSSLDNELTPFFDTLSSTLFFSSSWYEGFGGYDIFSSKFNGKMFESPVNIGQPFNSSKNDFYYTEIDSLRMLSSNRKGENEFCCTDIFTFYKPKFKILDTLSLDTLILSEKFESLEELNRKLPIKLYFHNDIPNPNSMDTSSLVNYIDSYNDYVKMIPKYKKEFSKGLKGEKLAIAQEDIEDFFIEYVEQGVKDLEQFVRLLKEELSAGKSIVLSVRGYASPLAQTQYNVNLTKRRIASLKNYLRTIDNGFFKSYLENNSASNAVLLIKEVPFGEFESDKSVSDNPNDVRQSIYSRKAALERKIEIQEIQFFSKDSLLFLSAEKQLIDLGKINSKKIVSADFKLINKSPYPIYIEKIDVPCDCNKVIASSSVIEENGTVNIKMTFNPENYKGEVVKSVYVHIKGTNEYYRLVMKAFVE